MSNTQERAKASLEQAVKGYTKSFEEKNGRKPTAEETLEFAKKVAVNIAQASTKSNPKDESDKRASALKVVNELAALHGVKFVHRREVTTQLEEGYKSGQIGHHDYLNFVESTRGGSTIAFKYGLDEKNNLFIEYAVAFCRDDENFDPLIGKQEALKKFLAGDVLDAQITHEPFGPVKLEKLTSAYKREENAAKAAQTLDRAVPTSVAILLKDFDKSAE